MFSFLKKPYNAVSVEKEMIKTDMFITVFIFGGYQFQNGQNKGKYTALNTISISAMC